MMGNLYMFLGCQILHFFSYRPVQVTAVGELYPKTNA